MKNKLLRCSEKLSFKFRNMIVKLRNNVKSDAA